MTVIGLFLASLFTVVELNCENLFDCQHDSLRNDYDFLPTSEKQWTTNRYWEKLNNIAREILSCGTDDRLPDVVCMVEVENDTVMRDLTRRSLLRNASYEYVMTDGIDERGIDVVLMYQTNTFHIIDHESLRIRRDSTERPTRDILHVVGELRSGDTIDVFVVHFPSRRNGVKQTRDYRLRAVSTILERIENLAENHSILVAGDFNDYRDDASLQAFAEAGFTNATADAKGNNGAEGTYKYRGEWGSLDHILLRGNIKRHLQTTHINDLPFLLQGEEEQKMPRRTYRGNFYQGGYSDHLPLVATFAF